MVRTLVFKIIFMIAIGSQIIYIAESFGQGHPIYPFSNSNIEKYENEYRDAHGIPMKKWRDEYYYNPVLIAQVAVHYYHHFYKTKDGESKKYFLKLANFLKNNFSDHGSWGGVAYKNNLSGSAYNLPNQWLSAMSQGYLLAIMAEAYELTKDKVYMELGNKILGSYETSVASGGIASDWGTTIWYDEYPTSPNKHVLNGFLFSLAGLYTYNEYEENTKARKLFNQGVLALHEHLSEFDAGFNSYYSQSENTQTSHGIASATGEGYHGLHIMQLLWLYQVTHNEYIKKWANIYLQYDFGDIRNYIDLKKFNVTASSSIEPIKSGPNNLHDRIWTYGGYWSSNKFPVSLELEFTRIVDDVRSLVLVTAGETIPEDSFRLEILIGKEWVLVNKKLLEKYVGNTRHHKHVVLRYDLDKHYNNAKRLKLTFLEHSKKVLAIREINVFFDMSLEISRILDKPPYWLKEVSSATNDG